MPGLRHAAHTCASCTNCNSGAQALSVHQSCSVYQGHKSMTFLITQISLSHPALRLSLYNLILATTDLFKGAFLFLLFKFLVFSGNPLEPRIIIFPLTVIFLPRPVANKPRHKRHLTVQIHYSYELCQRQQFRKHEEALRGWGVKWMKKWFLSKWMSSWGTSTQNGKRPITRTVVAKQDIL